MVLLLYPLGIQKFTATYNETITEEEGENVHEIHETTAVHENFTLKMFTKNTYH